MRRMPGTPLSSVLLAAILIILIVLAGCTGTAPARTTAAQTPVPENPAIGSFWKETRLPDLQGRGNISISGFAGKTVIVPVVSVSCPTCIVQLVRQLAEIDRLARENPDHIVVVSFDIDPDTGPGFIATYGNSQTSTGYAVRSLDNMTLQIFRRFGPFAVDTQTIPVILVCPDGHDLLLPAGLKTAESLNMTIVREC